MQVGFIGVGQMGAPIARRLLDAGNCVVVYDARPEAADVLVRAGATAASSPAELSATCATVFGCVTTVDTFREIVCGAQGLCARGNVLRQYVHLGTTGSACAVELSARLTDRGVAMVDAPVTGGVRRARDGELTTMASGPQDAFYAVQTLLSCYSTTVVYLSDRPGAAQVMKAINNMMSRINWVSACEAMVMGAKAGLDPERMLEVLNNGSGQNNATSTKIPLALKNCELGAALYISQKDGDLWRQEVERLDVPCTMGDSAQRLYARLFQDAPPEDDVVTLLSWLERWSGVQVPRTNRTP